MSGATSDIRDGDMGCPLSNGNAIITCSNFGVGYSDKTGPADMHTIGIGAIKWSSYIEVMGGEVLAINDVRVERFAIEGSDVTNLGVVHNVEFD